MNLETIITDLRSALPGPKSNTLSPEKLRAMADYLETLIPVPPSNRQMELRMRVDKLWHEAKAISGALVDIFMPGSLENPTRPELANKSFRLARLLSEDDSGAFHQYVHAEVERIFTDRVRDEFADEDLG
jgi:hypothetical protein